MLISILLSTVVFTVNAGQPVEIRAALSSSAATAGIGQAAPEPPAITESLKALESLLAKLSIPDSKTDTLVRARTAVSELLLLSAKWPAQSPADYRANLAANVGALEAASSRNWDVLAPTLEALAEDLEAKLDHCRRSGGRLGGKILVKVRTVVGGAEAKAWTVKYLPKALELLPTATPDRFPQLSSPTEEPLVPGRYLIWAEDSASQKRGERIIVRVGDGRKELLVDVPVPPPDK